MLNVFEHYASGERLYEKVVSPVYEKYGLTYMEFTIVMFLANNPQFDTATQIVTYRHLAKSHVSISIRRLCEEGYVECNYRDKNRRTIHISLTDKTDMLVKEGRAAQMRFRDIIFDGFSPEEMETISNLICRVDDNMKDYELKRRMEKQK